MAVSDERRPVGALAAAVGLLALVCLVATMPPAVMFGNDSGELSAAAAVLGVSHPTGYPLYLMLAKLGCVLVPVGTIAWRVTLLSVLCGALTVAVIVDLGGRLTQQRGAALAAGLALLCAGSFWAHALETDVHALHLLLLSLGLWCQVRWLADGDLRWLNLLGLCYGLGFTNHVTTVLWVPGTVALVALVAAERRWSPARVAGLLGRIAAWALPVLLLYAYLPLRAGLHPPLNWAHLDSLAGVWRHMTGREYAGNLGHTTPGEMARYLANHLWFLAYDWRYAGLLAGWGLLVAGRRARPLAAVLGGGLLLPLLFGAAYRVGDRSDYVLPAYLAVAVLVALGAAEAQRRLAGPGTGGDDLGRVLLGTVVLLLLPLLPAPPDGSAAARSAFDRSSLAGNDRARRHAQAVLDEARPHAAVLSLSDDLSFALWYMQVVEGRRRDLTVHALGSLEPERRRRAAEVLLARECALRPVDLTFFDAGLLAGRPWVAQPTTVRVLPAGEEPPANLGEELLELPAGLPDLPSWGLVRGAAEGPVSLPDPQPRAAGPRVALKPWTLGRVTVGWVPRTAAPAAAEVLVALFSEDQVAQMAGRRAAGPRVVNESSGGICRWVVSRLPFGPTVGGYTPAAGRVVVESYPLALPARSLMGRWQVRLGLRAWSAAGNESARWTEPSAVWAATVPIDTVVAYQR